MPLIGRIAAATARAYGLFSSIAQAVDPYFNYVVALLHGDGTNGGQNNTFLDSSTNNFTITRNGNATQGSFSPFSQTGWSNYFASSSTNMLSTASNAAFAFGTGDFTLEAFVFATTSQTDNWIIGLANNCWLRIGSAGQLEFYNSVTTTSILASSAMPINQWVHVAAVRSGTTLTIYQNGTSVASGTVSTNFSTNVACTVGNQSGFDRRWNGYLSNVRVVKGTAVYTSAFTPPTSALTAITNTSLLTCQNNRFVDNSTNAFSLTVGGSPSVQPFSPFNPTTAYSASSIGGSGYFDGSGDYLTAPNNAALDLGAGDFTLEIIWYPTAIPGSYYLLDKSSTNGWNLGGNASSFSFWANGANRLIFSRNPIIGQWNHIVVERVGSTIYGWINGASAGTTTYSAAISEATIFSLSANSFPINGYATCTRLVKGSAVYSGAAPSFPTTPLTAVTNTQLLLNFTNGAIFDNAAVADYETVGNAQISTSVKKYGTGSLAFDGSGDYLKTNSPTADSFVFGTGDFTIEMWVYVNSLPGTDMVLYDGRPSNGAYPCIILQGSTNKFIWYANTAAQITGSTPATSTWYHLAVCRVASQTKMFVNGTQVGSTYADTTNYLGSGTRPYIGANATNGLESFNGYIDDLRITKGVGRYQYNFTPPTAEFPNIGGTVTLTADPYYEYTTLLLPGNGTNGAQNNTFLDSSTNAFTITRNGNTTQGTFSPFSQTGWGNYFDGSGDYLTAPDNVAFTVGSGDWTLEAWIYPTASGAQKIAGQIDSAGTTVSLSFGIALNASTQVVVEAASGGTYYSAASGTAVTLNYWSHIAAVRNGTTIRLYVNGTQVATVSVSTASLNDSSTPFGIGRYGDYNSNYFSGYISNLRVVKGTAVYTANFTPPTTPLTAITNTSLLTCQSNRFIDNSTNNFTITRNGDVSVQAFSPFNPTASWSAATYGGSGYFDGSGDYLTTNATQAIPATGDFTIEAWVYPTVSGPGRNIVSQGTTGTSGRLQLNVHTDNTLQFAITSTIVYSTGTVQPFAWNYVAVTRTGSSVAFYINGASAGTATLSGTVQNTTLSVGSEWSGDPYRWLGYLTSVRISNTLRTISSSPTAPLTSDGNTVFLCNFTNAGIYDATSKNDLETVGNAQISTTQSKFGGSSMYFDGTGDYLYARNNQDLNLGTGDFTCECWVYVTSWSNANPHLFAKWNDGGNGYAYKGRILSSGASLRFGTGNNGTLSTEFDFSGANLSLNTWYHIAFTRYGSSLKAFVNGVQIGSTQTTSNSLSSNSAFLVGAASDGGLDYIFGYINDLRITKGIARYTSNFTPPTTAFLTL